MVTWFFENNKFANAWIPFDRGNQKKLEYVYRHHEELIKCIQERQKKQQAITTIKDVDLEEEDESIHNELQYDHSYIYINLKDSHFEHAITLYPAMLLGSLPDRDVLIVRAEMMDHKNKNLYEMDH